MAKPTPGGSHFRAEVGPLYTPISIQFANAGARVILAGRRKEQGAAVVNEIESAGGEARFVQTDVTEEESYC